MVLRLHFLHTTLELEVKIIAFFEPTICGGGIMVAACMSNFSGKLYWSNFKMFLFCMAILLAFGAVFGNDNIYIAICLATALLTYRHVDLGISQKAASLSLFCLFQRKNPQKRILDLPFDCIWCSFHWFSIRIGRFLQERCP